MKGKIFTFLLLAILTIGLVACGTSDDKKGKENNASKEAETGGTLNLAFGQQPNTIDPLMTTATATAYTAKPIFESLLTLDENFELAPMLAETYETSEDGKTITFKLRTGIKFHNGEEMTVDDVIASMERWMKMSSQAKSSLEGAKWEKVDDTTVALQLEKPSSIALFTVAEQNQQAAIMPKAIVEAAGDQAVAEYVGTGPFQFVEWKTDQYIHYKKFADYQARSEKSSGLAGEKQALVDEVFWHFVPDESTRISGLISGEYDVSIGVSPDNVEQIEMTDGIEPEVWTFGMELLVFNKQAGLFADQKMRQAVNAAIDFEAVLTASFGSDAFFELEHGIFRPNMEDWYVDSGKDQYNQKDLAKAEKLLKEAGYNGEEVVILTTREYPHYYNAAVATQQELEKIGMNVKIDIYDWATLLDRRNDPELWDIFFTGWDTQVIPQGYAFIDSSAEWAGWTDSKEMDALLDEIGETATQEETKEVVAKLQEEFWNYLPVINLGLFKNTDGYADKVTGFKNFVGPTIWNVTVDK